MVKTLNFTKDFGQSYLAIYVHMQCSINQKSAFWISRLLLKTQTFQTSCIESQRSLIN